MFVVTAAFPLTSDQPPVAVADPAAVMPSAQTQGGRTAPGEPRPATAVATPPSGETPDPWKLDPTRDPRALVGPRPAFEANILDAERNLQARLARMELARSHNELLRSTAPGQPPPTTGDAQAAADAQAAGPQTIDTSDNAGPAPPSLPPAER